MSDATQQSPDVLHPRRRWIGEAAVQIAAAFVSSPFAAKDNGMRSDEVGKLAVAIAVHIANAVWPVESAPTEEPANAQ